MSYETRITEIDGGDVTGLAIAWDGDEYATKCDPWRLSPCDSPAETLLVLVGDEQYSHLALAQFFGDDRNPEASMFLGLKEAERLLEYLPDAIERLKRARS